MKSRLSVLCLCLMTIGAVTLAAQGRPDVAQDRVAAGSVYTLSNAASGNAVLIFDRRADGSLRPAGHAATGGAGTSGGLGNQGALVLTRNHRWLLAVNAGSDSLSVFDVGPDGLALTDVEPSGGVRPVSVTEHGGLVYVVHAGSDSISGFRLDRDGHLAAIGDSWRPLSTSGTAPAQISFTPDGDRLVVTEKATNRIVTFDVDRDGVPGLPQIHDANGMTPFGFAFGTRDRLFVSEAFGGAETASAVSSYALDRDGGLTTLSPTVPTHQTAACWLALTPDSRFAYVTNTGSGSISGYRIDAAGQLELLDADGRTGVTGDGSSPIDLALTVGGRYLFSLHAGTQTIGAFRVEPDGSLIPLPFTGGLPAGANGLVVR